MLDRQNDYARQPPGSPILIELVPRFRRPQFAAFQILAGWLRAKRDYARQVSRKVVLLDDQRVVGLRMFFPSVRQQQHRAQIGWPSPELRE